MRPFSISEFFGQRDFTGEADVRGVSAGHVDYLVHGRASSFDGIKIPVAASVSMAASRRDSAHGSRRPECSHAWRAPIHL
jgi:hypothetical protein